MKFHFIKRSLIAILLAILIVTPITSSSASKITTTDIRNINNQTITSYEAVNEVAKEKARALTTIYGNKSVQYALIDSGKIEVYGQAGIYSKTDNISLTQNHIYGIGSISKIFTTAAVLNLVEDGKINLDDPVTAYIKEFKMSDPRYELITVRMLLNHSSGIFGSSFQNALLIGDNDTFSHDTFLKQLSTQRLKADPGAFSVYCNDGFTLSEILIERVSDLNYSKYIKDYFTIPLNMNDTKTPQDEFSRDRLSKVYYPGFTNPVPADNLNAIGAGGIYSSAADLCRFSQVFMIDSKNILTKNSIQAMEKNEYQNGIWPEEGDTTTAYGLGWDCINTYPFNQYGIKALYKGGDTLLYHSSLIVLPDYNMAVAVLSSDGVSVYDQIMGQEMLLTALKEKGIINKIKEDKSFFKPIAAAIPENLKEYEGIYGTSQGLLRVNFDDDDNLVISHIGNTSFLPEKFTYTTEGVFVISGGKSYTGLKFVKEENGNIYIQDKNYSFIPMLGQTANIYYIAQKLPKNIVTKEIQSAWNKRAGKKYFLLNEKYTSQAYPTSSVITKFDKAEDLTGYYGNATIIDENNCKSFLEIPVVHGRDILDYSIIHSKGKEYLSSGSHLLIGEDSISNLSMKHTTITIDEAGYASWYKINESLEEKKISINLLNQGAFALYDKDGICINYSYLDNKNEITLPENGYIVFIGKVDSKFQIIYL